MKRLLILSLLAILAGTANAQPDPEFWLELKWFINGNPGQNRTIAFGYDATASDSLGTNQGVPDVIWLKQINGGEQEGIPPFNNDDVRFTGQTNERGYMGGGTFVDIRKKPAQDSFMLQYELTFTAESSTTSMTIIWDPNKLPSAIKSLTLEPYGFSNPRKTDMKDTFMFELPNRDSISKYTKTILTLYHDVRMHVAGEENQEPTISLYPNPMTDQVQIKTAGDKAGRCEVFSTTGRKVFTKYMAAGETLLAINKDSLGASGVYHLQFIFDDGTVTTKTLHVL